jgi:dihydroorotate dehydrogenase
MAADMSVTLCGVTLKNPIIAASGTFHSGSTTRSSLI